MAADQQFELRPTALQSRGDTLTIRWSDGRSFRVRWEVVREFCPCATCRTRRSMSDEPPQPLQTWAGVRPTAMEPVGNYAYAISFSDGHGGGIYSLTLLRQLCERHGEPV